MPILGRLVTEGAIDVLADAYASTESGYRRTQNGIKASYDGMLVLLSLLDEMRQVRALLEKVTTEKAKRS